MAAPLRIGRQITGDMIVFWITPYDGMGVPADTDYIFGLGPCDQQRELLTCPEKLRPIVTAAMKHTQISMITIGLHAGLGLAMVIVEANDLKGWIDDDRDPMRGRRMALEAAVAEWAGGPGIAFEIIEIPPGPPFYPSDALAEKIR